MKDKRDKKNKKPLTITNYNNDLSILCFMPLLLICGFVPLITYVKYIDLSGTIQELYWVGGKQYLDFFSYWKYIFVLVLTFSAVIIFVYLYKQKKLALKDLKHYYILFGIYIFFVMISTIFSIDKQTALWGFVDMYQGMFVLISYCIIAVLTINFANSERDLKLFIRSFLFLIIVEGLIGVSQYFGFDFFQTNLGKDLILPDNMIVENLQFSFGPKTIYGTLFNTNFVGSFATLMLPLSVSFLLSSKTKKQVLISSISVMLMIFLWLGCNSRAGYLGVAVSSVFSIWLYRKLILKHWKVYLSLFIIIIFTVIGLNGASEGALYSRLQSFNLTKQLNDLKNINKYNVIFEEIALGEKNFSIKTNLETLNFKIQDDKLYFLDESNKELEITTKDNHIKFNDLRFKDYDIEISKNYPGVSVSRVTYWSTPKTNFYFSDSGVKILGSGGKLAEPIESDRFKLLDGYENFMSNRGYIWSRSIPMLDTYFIKGAGPDNYTIAFPQDDFVSKLNAGMNANTIIDKPHNMYLQIAINTGVISLITMLILWGSYIINSLILYSKITINTLETYVGASCLISVTGYLVAGMFNDQIISVAPLFWVILGLGISINYSLTKRKSEK